MTRITITCGIQRNHCANSNICRNILRHQVIVNIERNPSP